jgi:hypothetical protein
LAVSRAAASADKPPADAGSPAASAITRSTEWQDEACAFSDRSLAGTDYGYADAI